MAANVLLCRGQNEERGEKRNDCDDDIAVVMAAAAAAATLYYLEKLGFPIAAARVCLLLL